MKKTICLFSIFCFILIFSSCERRLSGAKNIIIYENDGSADDLVLENEWLHLRFLPRTTEIILTDKNSGSQWRSNPDQYDDKADTVTRYLMDSVFALEYTNVSGVGQTVYSGEQSVKLNAYGYEIVNGGIEVNYTAGDIERIYTIPPAVSEERMLEFMDNMDSSDASIVRSGYRLYDIDNLRSTDNREELLALYPDLERRKIFVLRPDAREFQKAEYEVIFADAGYTYDDYLSDIETYPAAGGRELPSFNISIRYTLEGRSLVVDVPFEKIGYRQSFPLTGLSLLPYFGAGGIEDEGYLLVPDGSGALIYFNNGRQNQIPYSNTVYGWDEGLIRNVVIVDNKAPYPVFGIQKNANAIVCIIERGASYATIRADVSLRNSSYNNVYPRFEMIHGELMDISGRSERAVIQYERALPEGESITLRYVICEQDGYVGMAKEYRAWLLKNYPPLANKKRDTGVPVAVEIPGAVNKTQHRLGIPFDLPLKLTSYKEMQGMINDFANFGWENVSIKLNGWFNNSVEHSPPTRVKLIGKLGSKRNFRDIAKAADQNGYNLYGEVDFYSIRNAKFLDGFNLYRDTARYINRKSIQRYPYSFVWFGERNRWGKLSSVARPSKMMSMIDNFSFKSSKIGINNIAFRHIGSRLAGDYDERQHVSREASMKMRQEKLAQLNNSNTGIMLLGGHSYAAPFADFIIDMALDDQGFGITNESVPFYQIALHGLVPYTGRAINLAEDYTKNLLKIIESGAGLYFSFITEETAILQETKFRQFYANEYHRWAGDADAIYKSFVKDFSGLYDQAIDDHLILAPGVRATVYEDGTMVIVNASDNDWDYQKSDGQTIKIKTDAYLVLRQGEL